ncbi:3395_t:CDS:2 [Funneliformis geosporum]|uniref:3395_t:CDS:1 n=1 Tax=Funneliformis geosporum TaxID=1117311 RepID=A0A9W4SZ68_9GLOM|nr:3395_t:CDS:2 [Funneliformis geosporum]
MLSKKALIYVLVYRNPEENIEEKFPTPANECIHIIINVSAIPATTNEIIIRLDKIDKNVKDIKREKSSVQISAVTDRNWMKIQEFTDLDYQATTREKEFTNLDLNLENERIDVFR